jgi:uncharacterized protein (DUF2147 family)
MRFSRSLLTLIAIVALFACTLAAQEIPPTLQQAIGHWQVIDDNGKLGGQVETYLVDGKLFGKVTQLRPGRHPGDVCDKCPGDLKNKPILGMVFLRDFKPSGQEWAGGTVVDPDNGKEYKGKVWNEGKDKLRLRGFIGISLLGRTQSWTRIP